MVEDGKGVGGWGGRVGARKEQKTYRVDIHCLSWLLKVLNDC